MKSVFLENKKEFFTKEQLDKARQVNLLSYVQENYIIKKHGNGTYKIIEDGHDSLVIYPATNSWYDFRNQRGGDVLSFLNDYENKSMVQVVTQLVGNERSIPLKKYNPVEKQVATMSFVLPQKAENNKRVFAYLIKTRGIDRDLVKQCIDEKTIYQSHEKMTKDNKEFYSNNCIFVGLDEKQKPKYASQRSMNDGTGFVLKMDVKNSQKEFGFLLKSSGENSSRVCVCESPIDALSIATINKLHNAPIPNIISLGGLSDKALATFIKNNPQVKEITLCLDNDEAGKAAGEKIKEKYSDQGFIVSVRFPKTKDFNQDLLDKIYPKEICKPSVIEKLNNMKEQVKQSAPQEVKKHNELCV